MNSANTLLSQNVYFYWLLFNSSYSQKHLLHMKLKNYWKINVHWNPANIHNCKWWCYLSGPHAKRMATSERQKALQEQYFFTCRCVACEQDTAKPAKETVCDWSRAFQCGHCTEPLIGPGVNAAKNIVRCDGCQREVKVDDLKRVSIFLISKIFLNNPNVFEITKGTPNYWNCASCQLYYGSYTKIKNPCFW